MDCSKLHWAIVTQCETSVVFGGVCWAQSNSSDFVEFIRAKGGRGVTHGHVEVTNLRFLVHTFDFVLTRYLLVERSFFLAIVAPMRAWLT
ncbi:hypothetical protein DSLPV1_227 [Dishui lake phycodnavirus 1]|uniref:hypothetical protein n=1 Tax=Dishui lake phycodnavirus 1 TaxID=2079134 RepID=UPI000CD6C083|nr:hypothetical protein C5Y57_gp171 [Dishui lake phycodnavirus 1]AUT19198.1 hypothetical protein DSLPV1_227 [Dishui lake phycodnavirus 1]